MMKIRVFVSAILLLVNAGLFAEDITGYMFLKDLSVFGIEKAVADSVGENIRKGVEDALAKSVEQDYGLEQNIFPISQFAVKSAGAEMAPVLCHGVRLLKDWVLTSGHCMRSIEENGFTDSAFEYSETQKMVFLGSSAPSRTRKTLQELFDFLVFNKSMPGNEYKEWMNWLENNFPFSPVFYCAGADYTIKRMWETGESVVSKSIELDLALLYINDITTAQDSLLSLYSEYLPDSYPEVKQFFKISKEAKNKEVVPFKILAAYTFFKSYNFFKDKEFYTWLSFDKNGDMTEPYKVTFKLDSNPESVLRMKREGLLVFDIESFSGVSGAPVFYKDILVGVISASLPGYYKKNVTVSPLLKTRHLELFANMNGAEDELEFVYTLE